MKPPRIVGFGNKGWTQDSLRYMVEQLSKVTSNISFGTTTSNTDEDMNMQCYKATGTTPVTPGTVFTVSHNLLHVPIGFSVLNTNAPAHIYNSGTPWTAAVNTSAGVNASLGTISLKCDAASVAFTIVIF